MRNENEKWILCFLSSRRLYLCVRFRCWAAKTTFDWLRYRIDSPSMLDEQQILGIL